jgi:acyl-CoA thioester hydrolase
MPLDRPPRSAYARFVPYTTRLRDNDQYRHMNNVVYYEYFDSAVNEWLMEKGGLTLPDGPVVGIVADTQCSFLAEVKWPQRVEVAMRMDRIGRTSLTYGLAMFGEGDETASAVCRYVHVYCTNPDRRPTPLPDLLRAEAEKLVVPGAAEVA